MDSQNQLARSRATVQTTLAFPRPGVAELYDALNPEIQSYLPTWESTYRNMAWLFGIHVSDAEFRPEDYERVGKMVARISRSRIDRDVPKPGVVLMGPASAGKSTVKKGLIDELGLKPIMVLTTRQPRPGEIDGVDSIFVTEQQLTELSQKGEIFSVNTHAHGTLEGNYLSASLKKPVVDAYLASDTPGFVADKQVRSWQKLRDEIAKEGVPPDIVSRTLPVFLLPPAPTILAGKAFNRVVKRVPEDDIPYVDRYLAVAKRQLDRSLGETTKIDLALTDPSFVFEVYTRYDDSMNVIVDLMGRNIKMN